MNWIVITAAAVLLQPATSPTAGPRGILSMRSNYLLGFPMGTPGGAEDQAVREAVASAYDGSSRILRALIGGPGTATLQVEHRLSGLAEIEDVASSLARQEVVSAIQQVGSVHTSWQEVFLEVDAGGASIQNAAVVRLTFTCHPEAASRVVDRLFAVNELFAELGLPRGRILVGLLGGADSPEVLMEGEFSDVAALEKAMKQLQGNERYTQLLESIEAVDVAEELLLAVDTPRGGPVVKPVPVEPVPGAAETRR
jgi:hypothetical protein